MEKDMGFSKCMADECLLFRNTDKGTLVLCLYIDDAPCVGDKDAITELKEEIKKYFSIKEEGEMKEYVSCKVKKIGKKSLMMYEKMTKHY